MIKKMTIRELADMACHLDIDEVIEFAVTHDSDEEPDDSNCNDWFFIKNMWIDGYDSHFLLIDYCGGQDAKCIAMNNYRPDADEDDVEIIPRLLEPMIMKELCIPAVDGFVYVQMN